MVLVEVIGICGRYVLISTIPELARLFSATFEPAELADWRPSWNVAPSRPVPAITAVPPPDEDGGDASGRSLALYRWGLVPTWAPTLAFGARTFNARAETVATKPTYRAAFRARRAVVVADAFYEWSTSADERGQPYLFARADGAPMALAGLWETWTPAKGTGGEHAAIRTCTVITAEAGPDVVGVHHRMPVVVEQGPMLDTWLDPARTNPRELQDLLGPSPAGTLRRHRVGRAVGSVANDGPELVEDLP